MAEWVALPSISGGPRGPFRDLRGPGKGMVGGDMGPDQGAAEQPLPRGFPRRSPSSAGPLRRYLPAAAGLTEPARGRAGEGPNSYGGAVPSASPLYGCPCRLPRFNRPSGIIPRGGGQLGDKAGKPPGSPSVPRLQAEGQPRPLGQLWDHRAGCPSFPVALLSRSQRAVQ